MKKMIITILLITLLQNMGIYAQSPTEQRCDVTFDYNTPAGWTTDTRLYTNPCPGLTWLTGTGSQTQGSHAFTGGRLEFKNIRDASMYRLYSPFPTVLSNTFIADFEARVNNANNASAVGFFLLALTEKSSIAPVYDPNPLCSTPTNNSAIVVNVQNAAAGTPMTLSVITKFNSAITTTPLAFTVQSGVTYYYRLIRKSDSQIILQVFGNSARTGTPLFTSACIGIDPGISGLKFIQHANNPLGSISRTFSGFIDSVCIRNNTADACCKPKISGANTICNAGTPATFQVNITGGNQYTLILPAGVTGNLNPATGLITITNWGAITTLPKAVDIRIRMRCNCEDQETLLTVYVYPERNADFNFQNLGTNGTALTNFSCVAPIGITGILHQWEIYNSDAAGTAVGWPTTIRPVFFQTSVGGSGNSVFNVTATGVPSYPNLLTNHFYLVRHGLNFEGTVCGWKSKDRVIYFSNANKMVELGEPGTTEFKTKLDQLKIK